MDPSPLAPGSTGGGSSSGSLPPLPDWVLWLQAGFTALVAVLFVALLVETRQQSGRIQELQERLQGLENSRALERTTGLEEQLRAAVERLQALEGDSSRLDVLQAETDSLRDQLRELGSAPVPRSPGRPQAAVAPSAAPPPAPRSEGTETSPPGAGVSPALPGGAGQP
jgi:hypothetical protein